MSASRSRRGHLSLVPPAPTAATPGPLRPLSPAEMLAAIPDEQLAPAVGCLPSLRAVQLAQAVIFHIAARGGDETQETAILLAADVEILAQNCVGLPRRTW